MIKIWLGVCLLLLVVGRVTGLSWSRVLLRSHSQINKRSGAVNKKTALVGIAPLKSGQHGESESSNGLPEYFSSLEAIVVKQGLEIAGLKTELAELREYHNKSFAQMTELCDLISWQLDRALTFEKAHADSKRGDKEGLKVPFVDNHGIVDKIEESDVDDDDDDDDEDDDEDGGGVDGAAATSSFPRTSLPSSSSSLSPNNNRASSFSPVPVLPPASCLAMSSAVEAGVRIGGAGVKGIGAFAAVPFSEGVCVGDYEGEWMSLSDLDARYPHTAAPLEPGQERPKPTAADDEWREDRLKCGVGLTGDYLYGAGPDTFVDGENMFLSNWGRFVNHAPEASPGCNLRCETIEKDAATGKPRVGLFAVRDVSPGEELLFDYGDNYWNDTNETAKTASP